MKLRLHVLIFLGAVVLMFPAAKAQDSLDALLDRYGLHSLSPDERARVKRLVGDILNVSANGNCPASNRTIETRIEGEFEGWDGDTVVRLDNGQIWEQSQYYYEYRYAFRPEVSVFFSNGRWQMLVEGTRQPVTVDCIR